MTRERAIEVSDALASFGQSHSIVVGVNDGYVPRERYTVNVTPTLTYTETDITALQRLADSLKCGIGYVAGSFTFTESRGGDAA
jgi:hypothetical protein